jgi:hypothetical protein
LEQLMTFIKELNVQAKIALIFALVALLVLVGGVVHFLNLSSLAWALPVFSPAEKFGPGLYGALARIRLTFAAILFMEVLLLLPLGLWLMWTLAPLLKKAEEELPAGNTSKPLLPRADEPVIAPALKEIGTLANQMAETSRNANQVMEHSLAAIRKGIAISEVTLEALKENKKFTVKVTRLIENITPSFQKQPDSFH